MSARRAMLLIVVIVAVLGASMLMAAWGLRRTAVSARGSGVLRFEVPAQLEESHLSFGHLSLAGLPSRRLTVWEVVRALRSGARDPQIKALVLHVGPIDWGWGKLEEVRNAVLTFRSAGKPIYVSLAGGGEREFLLASAADRVCVAPTLTLQLDGLSASATFYRGAFDKFAISPNFAHVGRYKSGAETYTNTRMSEPSREALGALLDDFSTLLVDTLAAARGMTPDSIRALLDRGPFDAPEALHLGLIDSLLYPSDVDTLAARHASGRPASVDLERYLDRLDEPRTAARIALVVASGTIASGRSRDNPVEGRVLGTETLIGALREARTRQGIRAIVLRVDSPGGEADASDEIWREIERCRESKPMIVSMSDLAASGGYLIAVAGESLLAHPSTLTGSIGVYGGKLNVIGLLHKVGLNVETVTRGRHADMLSPYRDFTSEEADLYQRHLDRFYRVFLGRVAKGRRLSEAAVESAAQGRVWSGLAARRLGLVDRLGGLEEAIGMARARGGFRAEEIVQVEVFPRSQGAFLSRLISDLMSDESESRAWQEFPSFLQTWMAASRFPAGAVLALMPWTLDIR